MANILTFDIECSGLRSDFGLLFCVGYKWYGKKAQSFNIYDYPNWRTDFTDSRRLLRDFYKVWCSADMVVGYNSKIFDVKWLNGKLWHYGMPLLPPVPHVDLYFAAKNTLNLSRKSLANISAVGRFAERKYSDFDNVEWLKASVGHLPSLRSIVKHCHADLKVTEEAYDRLRPYIRTHPNVASPGTTGCRVCGGHNLQRRGGYLAATKVAKQRLCCKDCGGWSVRDILKGASLVGAWPLR